MLIARISLQMGSFDVESGRAMIPVLHRKITGVYGLIAD
jgi:hypothetical protein